MLSAPAAPLDRCVTHDRRVEEPGHGAFHLCQRLSQKEATSIPGASSPMEAMPPSCPSWACSLRWRPAQAMPRPAAEDLVDQLRIMIDAIGADGGLSITLAAMVLLCG